MHGRERAMSTDPFGCADFITLIVCRLIVVNALNMTGCQSQTPASCLESACASSGLSAAYRRRSSRSWLICTATTSAVLNAGSGT